MLAAQDEPLAPLYLVLDSGYSYFSRSPLVGSPSPASSDHERLLSFYFRKVGGSAPGGCPGISTEDVAMTVNLLVESLAKHICNQPKNERILIGIDGVDGSGKSTFAERLHRSVHPSRPVLLIHLDDFHNPRHVRHARGQRSPMGFWLDSYNYEIFEQSVIAPLSPAGDGHVLGGTYDVETEQPLKPRWIVAPDNAVVIVEGIFLHRDELSSVWEVSVFLDVPFAETALRMAQRDGTPSDPSHPRMVRYVDGQLLYFAAAKPWERATWVIDNADVAAPRIIAPHSSFAAQVCQQ